MPNFNKYTNYTDNTSFSGVVYGANAPVLEVEQNEMQEIFNTKLRGLTDIIGDCIIPSTGGSFSYANDSVSIRKCIAISHGFIGFVNSTDVSVSSVGDRVYVKLEEKTVTKSTTLKEYGNVNGSSITNPIQDNRVGSETSRRKMIEVSVLKSSSALQDTTTVHYVFVGELTSSEVFTFKHVLTSNLVENINSLLNLPSAVASAESIAESAYNLAQGLSGQISSIIAQSGTSDTEVVAARTNGVIGATNTTLAERLDNDFYTLQQDIRPIDSTFSRSDASAPAKETGDRLSSLETEIEGKQDILIFDNAPLEDSQHPVKSGGVFNVTKDTISVVSSVLGITDPNKKYLNETDGYLYEYDTTTSTWKKKVLPIQTEVEDIKEDLSVNNAVDYTRGKGTTGTHQAVTYTNNGNGTWTVNGTASAASFRTILSGLDGWSTGLRAGKTYYVKYNSTDANVVLRVYPYYSGSIGSILLETSTDAEFTIPSDASGLAVRLFVGNGKTVNNATVRLGVLNALPQSELTQSINDRIPYQRKLAFFGDSIMWGRDGNGSASTRVADTIPVTVEKRLGVTCDNFGVGGMGFLRPADSTNEIAYDKIASTNITGYDVIVLCFGTNDGFKPVGTYDSTDETTCLGQFNKIINYIYTQNPTAYIIVFAPFNGTNAGSYPDYWYGTPGGSATSREILSDALKKACEYYWIPYIEQTTSPINAKTITAALPDGVHPSEAYYRKIGDWFAGKIISVSTNRGADVETSFNAPMLTIIDDDGDTHFLYDLVPLIQELHVPIASAVTTTRIGSASRWMSWEQIRTCAESGAEILCHMYSHPTSSEIAAMSEAEIQHRLYMAKNCMKANGVDSDVLVYSYSTGTSSDGAKLHTAAEHVFDCAFAVNGGTSDSTAPEYNGAPISANSDRYMLPRYRIDLGYNYDLVTMKAIIDDIAANGGWAVWMIHTSSGNQTTGYWRAIDDGTGNPDLNATPDSDGTGNYLGKTVIVPKLREAIQYALGKGVPLVTAEYGIKKYFGL